MSRPLLILLLAAGACGSGNRPGSSSSEQPQVVYLGVDGAKDPRVDQRVEELIRRRFDIIDRDTYMEKARELDAEKITRKNLAKVTSELGAVALVHGSAKGKKVTVFVRDQRRGKIVERYKLTLRKGVLAKKSDRALDKRLLASVKIPKKKKKKKKEEEEEEPPPPPPEEEEEAVAEKEPKKERKKEKAPVAEEEEQDEDPPPKIEVDESGQAIDDEVPPM
ncbi:MAG TPA: hypothetical protein VMZ28_06290 [Kofleriaceae bacterium]|nr:hypothetical protein [Kofleriaceae bacterium]